MPGRNSRKQNPLTAAEIEKFKTLLLKKRREIVGDVQGIEPKQARTAAAGDLSCMPIHMADVGTDNYEQELSLGLLDSEIKLLREIDEALLRIEKGTYGICQGSGKQISRARLKAKPWAKYCVEYAKSLEQRKAT